MCWCNSKLRSPCCGEMGCNPELDEQAPPSVGEGRDYIIETKHQDSENTQEVLIRQSQLSLWQSYCDKKMECEKWKELFEKTLDMLEYSHITGEWAYDHEKVSDFIGEMYDTLKEEKNDK